MTQTNTMLTTALAKATFEPDTALSPEEYATVERFGMDRPSA